MFHKMSDEDWDSVINVHLQGSYNVCKAAVNHFREQEEGSFVLFTSTSGLIGNVGQANYAAAKMGIVGMSRIIAMEGAMKNVRSNTIAPFAWTRMIATIPVKDEASAKRVERMKNMMRADQVAQLAVSLASPGHQDRLGPDLRGARQRNLPDEPAAPDPRPGQGRRLDAADHRRALHAGHGAQLHRTGRDHERVRLGPDLRAYQWGCCGAWPANSARRRAVPGWVPGGGAAGSAQQISAISKLGLNATCPPSTR